jgi:anti-sigma factor ChrR (cupin superfamily)
MSDSLQDLASDYLAGLLTSEEAAVFEVHLAAAGPEERASFAAMQDTAALIMLSETHARKAPAAARDAILAAATAEQPPIFTYMMDDEGWEPLPIPLPGARWKPLYVLPSGPQSFLMELPPGCEFPDHPHYGAEECLLLKGDLVNEGRVLRPGDYVRARGGTHHHGLHTIGGCVCLIVLRAA